MDRPPRMIEDSRISFDHHPSLSDFNVSKKGYLASHAGVDFGYISTSTLVLDTKSCSNSRILLLQRAASDSDPNKWEPPGGACDDDDPSILHAAARELFEEAGLPAARFCGVVGDPHFFTLDDGKKVCQFNFAVLVQSENGQELEPRLDPEEHQKFVWATEEEVKMRNSNGLELDFTREEVLSTVLQAFRFLRSGDWHRSDDEGKDS